MRAFVAIELDDVVRARLAQVQGDLAEAGAAIRWVRPELLHLTVKFLGEIADDAGPRLTARVAERVESLAPFDLRLSGLGIMPGPRRPRVLMVRAEPVPPGLLRVAEALDDAFIELGVDADRRPFKAHITLGRFKGPKNLAQLIQAMGRWAGEDLGTVRVERVACVESRLSREGPSYTVLAGPRLLGTPA